MNEQPKIEFGKVEVLRKHMLLTVEQISELFDVTRMTYYGWLKGKAMRRVNEYKVRRVLKQLLNVMNQHEWPTPEAIGAGSKQRFLILKQLIDEDEE